MTTKARLSALFKIKAEWRYDELEPYLDALLEAEVGKTRQEIAIRNARQVKKPNGDITYVRRQ